MCLAMLTRAILNHLKVFCFNVAVTVHLVQRMITTLPSSKQNTVQPIVLHKYALKLKYNVNIQGNNLNYS